MRYVAGLAVIVIASVVWSAGCEHFSSENKEQARQLLEACLRESWTQGEQVGKFGVACQALNDWARRVGWAAQPSTPTQ
jgi:hypothetical protein